MKLIAQHDEQTATGNHADFFPLAVDDLCVLQRSEQYFTSSQVFAHALRHVISRPQITHHFEGSDALLPLKLMAKHWLGDRALHPPLPQRRQHVGQRARRRDARNIAPDTAN